MHFIAFATLALSVLSFSQTNAKELLDRADATTGCKYPAHAAPLPILGKPCGFICKDGFIPSPLLNPTACVCPKPLTSCNGVCSIFKACPSGHAKRGLFGSTDLRCPKTLTACGIVGRSAKSWECVDTQNDLESCGGCMISALSGQDIPDGVDCTAIPNVSDVSCRQGQCVVHRCMEGFARSLSGEACVETESPTESSEFFASQAGTEYRLAN